MADQPTQPQSPPPAPSHAPATAPTQPTTQYSSQPAAKPGFRWSRLIFLPFKSKLFALATIAVLFGAGALAYNAINQGAVDGLALDAAPWSLRAGVSFMAAFVFAFLMRLAIKMALIVGGLLIGGAMLLHWLGLGVSAEGIEQLKEGVQHATATIKAQGNAYWETAQQYLPSGGAAGLGLWKGSRQEIV